MCFPAPAFQYAEHTLIRTHTQSESKLNPWSSCRENSLSLSLAFMLMITTSHRNVFICLMPRMCVCVYFLLLILTQYRRCRTCEKKKQNEREFLIKLLRRRHDKEKSGIFLFYAKIKKFSHLLHSYPFMRAIYVSVDERNGEAYKALILRLHNEVHKTLFRSYDTT
jgi:hypothetical protein